MAKTKMICPFSGELCEECPLYRGRHYYLCFCERYRGHLNESAEATETMALPASWLNPRKNFEIPSIKSRSAIDPFDIIMKEREEGGLN